MPTSIFDTPETQVVPGGTSPQTGPAVVPGGTRVQSIFDTTLDNASPALDRAAPPANPTETRKRRQTMGRMPLAHKKFAIDRTFSEAAKEDVQELSNFEFLAKKFESGQLTDRLGMAGSFLRDRRTPEARAEVDALNQRIVDLGIAENEKEGFIGFLGEASEVLGQMYQGMVTPDAAAKALGGASVGSTLGLAGGPFAPVTATAGAAAGAGAGLVGHLVQHTFQVEGGHAYLDMIQAGINEDTAGYLSYGVGVANSALEVVGAALVLKPVSEATKRVLKQGIKEAFTSPKVLEIFGGFAKDYGLAVLGETGTEVLQEITQVAAEEWGKHLEGLEGASPEEVAKRLEQIAVKTAKAMSVLAVPGAGINVAVKAKEAQQAKPKAKALDQLVQSFQATKLSQKEPEVAAQHFDDVMQSVGAAEMFMPAEAVAEIFKPEEIQAMGLTERVHDALVEGGDVVLSAKEFARQIILQDRYDLVKDDVRTAETGMTVNEAKLWDESGLQDEIDYAEQIEEVHGGTDEVLADIGPARPEQEVTTAEVVPEAQRPGEDVAAEAASVADQLMEIIEEDIDVRSANATAALKQALRGLRSEPENAPVTIAEAELGLLGFFRSAEEAGLTPKEYETYLAKVVKAADGARRRRADAILKQEQRNNTETWKREEAEVKDQVSETLSKQQTYAALRGIGRERLDVAELEQVLQDIAIDEEIVFTNPEGLVIWPKEGQARERSRVHGRTLLGSLPKQNGRAIHTPKGQSGISVQEYAELNGYSSAHEMVIDFITAPEFATVVDSRTHDIMIERHGDLLERNQAIFEERKRILNNDYTDVITTELNALRKARGEKAMSAKLIRLAARQALARDSVKDVQVARYIRQASKVARMAAKALRKGKLLEAETLKFQQVLNFEKAKEAQKATNKLAQQRQYLANMRDGKNSLVEGGKWQNAIDEILDHINFNMNTLSPKRVGVLKYLVRNARASVRIRAQRLLDNNARVHWQKMSLGDFNDVYNDVREIHHKGAQEAKFLRDIEKEDVESSIDDIEAAFAQNVTTKTDRFEWWGNFKHNVDQLRVLLFHVDTVLREIDGFKDLGVVYQNIKGRYDQGMKRGYLPGQRGYLREKRDVFKNVDNLWKVFDKAERKAFNNQVKIPGMDRKMSHHERLMVLANLGNDLNVDALIETGTVTKAEMQAIMEHASKKDWDFVQSVWDYLETFKPKISEAEMRRRNEQPDWVVATEIETKFGTYRGGYFPIRYKNEQSVSPSTGSLQALQDQMKNGDHASSMTQRGHLKARKQAGPSRKVLLDGIIITSHLDNVIYDLEMGDAFRDIFNVVHHPRFKQVFVDHGQKHRWEMIDVWLRDALTQEQTAGDQMSRKLRWLRAGFTAAALGFNVGVGALQILGVLQSGVQIGKRNMWRGIYAYLSNPAQAHRMVVELSPGYMATRTETWNKDILDAQRATKLSLRKSWGQGMQTAAFWMIKRMQQVTDTMTFLGALSQANEQGMGHADAIAHAENMVSRTQASGIFAERSALERGSLGPNTRQHEFVRSFTALTSYFIAKYNVAYEQNKKTNFRSPYEAFNWAMNFAMLYVIESLVAQFIKGQWPDDDEKWDADPFWLYAGKQTFYTYSAQFPLAREAVGALQGFTTGGVIGTFSEAIGRLGVQLGQGEWDMALFKSLNNTGGMLFHYPSRQMNKSIEAMLGEDSHENGLVEFIMGKNWER